jgi:SAM-dependent methyltransferase
VVISNCVINLSPEKDKVFREIYRVLKQGGRFYVSDIVVLNQLPGVIADSSAAYIGCIAGAVVKTQYITAIQAAGFRDVEVLQEKDLALDCLADDPVMKAIDKKSEKISQSLAGIGGSIKSILITGVKSS